MAGITPTNASEPDRQAILAIDQGAANLSMSKTIPGGSPFFYLEGPMQNGLKVKDITMSPNPWHIGVMGSLSSTVTIDRNISTLVIDFSVQTKDKTHDWTKIIADKDALCEYATVKQGDKKLGNQCTPKIGDVEIETELPLAPGYVRPGPYYIDIKLLADEVELAHVGAKIQLEDIDEVGSVVPQSS